MAKRKPRKKRTWRNAILVWLLTPLLVWLFAFAVWYHWNKITKIFASDTTKPPAKSVQEVDKAGRGGTNGLTERIVDEDRKKLDQILKERR